MRPPLRILPQILLPLMNRQSRFRRLVHVARSDLYA
jgi:hypothetical protein